MHLHAGTPAGKQDCLLCLMLLFIVNNWWSQAIMHGWLTPKRHCQVQGLRRTISCKKRWRTGGVHRRRVRAAARTPQAAGGLMQLYQKLSRRYLGHPVFYQQLSLCSWSQCLPASPGGAAYIPALHTLSQRIRCFVIGPHGDDRRGDIEHLLMLRPKLLLGFQQERRGVEGRGEWMM